METLVTLEDVKENLKDVSNRARDIVNKSQDPNILISVTNSVLLSQILVELVEIRERL